MWQTSWIVFFTHLDHESIKKPYTYELFQVLYTTYETVYSTTIISSDKRSAPVDPDIRH